VRRAHTLSLERDVPGCATRRRLPYDCSIDRACRIGRWHVFAVSHLGRERDGARRTVRVARRVARRTRGVLLSPAPALAFGRSGAGPLRMSLTSLGVVVAAMAVLLVLIIAIVASGGLPQVHEWRALLRG
jgi:hypothetical protein